MKEVNESVIYKAVVSAFSEYLKKAVNKIFNVFLLKLSLFQQFCQFYGWILVLHEVGYFLVDKVGEVHNRGGTEVWEKFVPMQSKQSQ